MFGTVLALLATWAVGMPLFASPDEPAHLFKAYGTAHGQLVGDEEPGWPANIRRFDVPPAMRTPDLRCYFGSPAQPANCATGSDPNTLSSAAVYPPFWYAAVGMPTRLVGRASTQRAYRITAAALCAALIAVAFHIARRSRQRRLTPLMLVGLPPMAVFLAGTVNPNAFEVCAFLVLAALMLHLQHRQARTAMGGAIVGCIVAAVLLSRFASALWVVAFAVVVAVLLGWNGLKPFLNRRFLTPALGCTAGATALLVAWSRYAKVQADDPRTATQMGLFAVARTTLRALPTLSRQMIGVLGWLDTELPWFVYAAFAVFSVVIVVGVVWSRDRRLIAATALVLLSLVVAPVATNVLTAARAGLIWQGRYSLPLFALLGPLGMLGWHQVVGQRPHLAPWLRWGACVAFAGAEIAAFWQALRRYCVGANGPIWLSGNLPWHPGVAPMLLIAVNAVLVVAMCSLLLRSTAR